MQDIDALVREAQQGNRAAFGQVYEAFFARVYRYAAARVGPGADAEDIAQEVFVKALNALHRYKFTGPPFAAWLFRIAHNLVVDRARHARSAAAAGAPAPIDEALPLPGADNVEALAIQSVDIDALRDALGRVTALQRQVIELRFFAGLSLAETASAMGRNQNAVKALQHSALGALRRILVPAGGAEVAR